MKEIYVADCETDPFKAGRIPKPFIWGAYNGADYKEFSTPREFVEYMSQIDCICYAHNGGKFDWFFIIEFFETFEPLMVINGRIAKFKIGLCEFRDSYNILPVPLREFNKDEFDYSILEESERNKPGNMRKIRDYLKSDCVNLYHFVIAFIERYGLSLTLAGAAMKVWQKISETKAPQTSKAFYDTLAPFYYGGRVQCFKSGLINYPFKVIDINSAYPFAMKHLHPFGETYVVTDSLPNSREYIQRSFITIECISQGAFPYREKNGLSFPDDGIRRIYNVSGWEFLVAIDTRTIREWDIIEVIQFSDSIKFDNYIDHFYSEKTAAKDQDDRAAYIFAKLFLNSLYGKFGANPDNYREYMIIESRYINAAEEEGFGFNAEIQNSNLSLVSKPLTEFKARYYNVAVAASITGFVRAYLWQSINQCEGVIYCDTDSIACQSTGNLPLHPSDLGAWDIEANCDLGAVAGKKLYAFRGLDDKWKIASKGVRLTWEQVFSIADNQEVIYSPEAPTFSLKRGIGFTKRKIRKNV